MSHDEFAESKGLGYRPNIRASLTLTGLEPGTKIDLVFIYFDLYQYNDLSLPCADYLEITGAVQTPSGYRIPKLCGWKNFNESVFETIVVRKDWIKFTFKTREINNGNKGFLLRYTVLPEDGQTSTFWYSSYTTESSANEETGSSPSSATKLKAKISSGKLTLFIVSQT